jgi:hypothetical protein
MLISLLLLLPIRIISARRFVARCSPIVLAERVDPITNPNKVNGHAHDIVGSSGISLDAHRADLTGASTCTTCNFGYFYQTHQYVDMITLLIGFQACTIRIRMALLLTFH